MNTHTYALPYAHNDQKEKTFIIARFFAWCKAQEQRRLFWLALILVSLTCVVTPLTVLAVAFSGSDDFTLWGVMMGSITLSLIVNLAAMPTKVTIPVFFLSLLVDLGLIIKCLALAAA